MDQYRQELANSGLKRTKHRLAVLDLIAGGDRPMTADQVYEALRGQQVAINLSTVYRTLEVLALNGLLTRLGLSGDGRHLFEYNRRVHRHYLVCLTCRTVKPIDGCPLEEYSRTLAATTHYQISGHKLDIFGFCPKCQKNQSEKS